MKTWFVAEMHCDHVLFAVEFGNGRIGKPAAGRSVFFNFEAGLTQCFSIRSAAFRTSARPMPVPSRLVLSRWNMTKYE